MVIKVSVFSVFSFLAAIVCYILRVYIQKYKLSISYYGLISLILAFDRFALMT